jgi:hypothetical protein
MGRLALEELRERQPRRERLLRPGSGTTLCGGFDGQAAMRPGVFALTEQGIRSTLDDVWHGTLWTYEIGLRLSLLKEEPQARKHPCIYRLAFTRRHEGHLPNASQS